MTQALAKGADGTVARPLRVLVPLIQADLKQGREAAERAGMPYYRAAGEKLKEAKAQLDHGQFTAWAQRNFSLGMTQLRLYMRLANDGQNDAITSFSSLGDLRRTTDPSYQPRPGRQPWHEPVKQIVSKVDTETLNLKREELKRADERDAQRKLALQLIDIGYKVLARTLHPDKGGSRDAMARLNAVRDRLKQCV